MGDADMVFNVAVLNDRRVIPFVHAEQSRLPDRGGIVAPADVGVPEHVAGELPVELRRTLSHCLLRIEHEGQRLIGDGDGAGSLRSGDLVLRDDDGDVVAIVADVAVQQAAVGDVLMRRLDRPGVSGSRELDIRDIKAGVDGDDTGDGFRLFGIDGGDIAVRDGGAHDARNKCAAGTEIVRVSGSAGRLVAGIHADDALTCAAHMQSLLSRSDGSMGRKWQPEFVHSARYFSWIVIL